jgi:hypothetical protein
MHWRAASRRHSGISTEKAGTGRRRASLSDPPQEHGTLSESFCLSIPLFRIPTSDSDKYTNFGCCYVIGKHNHVLFHRTNPLSRAQVRLWPDICNWTRQHPARHCLRCRDHARQESSQSEASAQAQPCQLLHFIPQPKISQPYSSCRLAFQPSLCLPLPMNISHQFSCIASWFSISPRLSHPPPRRHLRRCRPPRRPRPLGRLPLRNRPPRLP